MTAKENIATIVPHLPATARSPSLQTTLHSGSDLY